MTERNFDAEYDFGAQPGHTFQLGGQTWHTKAVAPVQAFRDDLAGIDAAIKFISRVIVPEEREAFIAMIEDDDSPISVFQLDTLAAWLIEVTSGRPTEAPDSSGSGGAPTSTSLKAVSSSPAAAGKS